MGSIIIAMPKLEDAKRIRDIVSSLDVQTIDICTTGADIFERAHELDSGIVISTRRFQDMHCSEIAQNLPEYFEILILISKKRADSCPSNIKKFETPFRVSEFMSTVEMMLSQLERRTQKEKKKTQKRSFEEKKCINEAKKVLMEKNHMEEEEAFRYIQKCSMDSCTNMVEAAQMILLLKDK